MVAPSGRVKLDILLETPLLFSSASMVNGRVALDDEVLKAVSRGVIMFFRWAYGLAYLGHGLLDRIWLFPDTFLWPFRGWRFHVWGRRGSEQEKIGMAYWYAFTRRPELWIWEVGGMVALIWFCWRHRLYRPARLLDFVCTGRVSSDR